MKWIAVVPMLFISISFAQEVTPPREASASSLPKGAIYNRPVAKDISKGVALGGYLDVGFENTNGTGSNQTFFDEERFVPFIYGEIHPRIHVASEIEFEH